MSPTRLRIASFCLIATALSRFVLPVHSDDAVSSSPVVKKLPAPRDFDAACEAAEKIFEAEIQSADKIYMAARRKAAEKRLLSYKARLAHFTRAGDFDRAVSVREMVDAMENSPDDAIRPKPKTVKFEGHDYSLVEQNCTWHIAKKRCEEMGGHFAILETNQEAQFVSRLCGSHIAFVGASDEANEGQWTWINGKPMTIGNVHLDNGQGVEHYLVWDGKSWNDWHQGVRPFFVCEWD